MSYKLWPIPDTFLISSGLKNLLDLRYSIIACTLASPSPDNDNNSSLVAVFILINPLSLIVELSAELLFKQASLVILG